MDKLSFLDGDQPNTEELPIEAASEPVAEASAPEPVEPAAVVAAPVAEPTRPEPGYVPLAAMMDERDKRKALEEQLAAYQRAQQPAYVPDALTDPDGAIKHSVASMQGELMETKLNMSEIGARRFYGEDQVEAAKTWALQKFSQSPTFQAEVLSKPDPYDFAVQQYKRDQISSTVTEDDFKAFQSWKAAQTALAGTQPAASAAPPNTAQSPPRSIAGEPSSGGITHVPIDEAAGYNALFQ